MTPSCEAYRAEKQNPPRAALIGKDRVRYSRWACIVNHSIRYSCVCLLKSIICRKYVSRVLMPSTHCCGFAMPTRVSFVQQYKYSSRTCKHLNQTSGGSHLQFLAFDALPFEEHRSKYGEPGTSNGDIEAAHDSAIVRQLHTVLELGGNDAS